MPVIVYKKRDIPINIKETIKTMMNTPDNYISNDCCTYDLETKLKELHITSDLDLEEDTKKQLQHLIESEDIICTKFHPLMSINYLGWLLWAICEVNFYKECYQYTDSDEWILVLVKE